MYRSLTANATATRLSTALAAQSADVKAKAAALTSARSASAAAANRATTAATADTTARAQYAASAKALSDATATLARLRKKKPVDKAAVARTQKFVTAATPTVTARLATITRTAAALKDARARNVAASAALSGTSGAWLAANAALTRTQQQVAGLVPAASLADQAATISRDVVAQVRPGFTTADTTKVYGVTVNKIAAYPFQRMIDDAKAAGIVLSGGGFRTKEQQIALRTTNGCPDVWTAPSSSCRVPTAIPGHSLHEIGLAVDITYNGRTVARNTPAFAWLSAHAATYGFVNLPSEAWHWSITGS